MYGIMMRWVGGDESIYWGEWIDRLIEWYGCWSWWWDNVCSTSRSNWLVGVSLMTTSRNCGVSCMAMRRTEGDLAPVVSSNCSMLLVVYLFTADDVCCASLFPTRCVVSFWCVGEALTVPKKNSTVGSTLLHLDLSFYYPSAWRWQSLRVFVTSSLVQWAGVVVTNMHAAAHAKCVTSLFPSAGSSHVFVPRCCNIRRNLKPLFSWILRHQSTSISRFFTLYLHDSWALLVGINAGIWALENNQQQQHQSERKAKSKQAMNIVDGDTTNNTKFLDMLELRVNELYQWIHEQAFRMSPLDKQSELQHRVSHIIPQFPHWSQLSHNHGPSSSSLSTTTSPLLHDTHTVVGCEHQETLTKEQKAKIYFLRGKLLEVFHDYNKESEDCLSKSVKLNPQFMDAWNVLGHCLWKKNDLIGAKNCYTTALSLNRNKVSLRELSRVLRLIDPTQQITGSGTTEDSSSSRSSSSGSGSHRTKNNTTSNSSSSSHNNSHNDMLRQQLLTRIRIENLKESVARAKEAIQLDMSDGESWYVLGNAYLSHYIAYSLNISDLDRALAAFRRAESSPSAIAHDPDLHYNRSMILKLLERYEEAYQGFVRAMELDPSLHEQCTVHMRDIEQLVNRSVELIDSRGQLSPKELKATLSKFPKLINCCVQNHLQEVTLAEMIQQQQQQRLSAAQVSNPFTNRALTVRVIKMLSLSTSLPLYVYACVHVCMCVYAFFFIHCLIHTDILIY